MKTLNIIGRGLSPGQHLTIDGIRALRSTEKIFGIEQDYTSWEILSREFGFKEITDITQLYQCGARDKENYNSFLEFIQESLEKFSSISLLVAGNPCFGVSFVQMLKSNPIPNIKMNIIDGISSFDVMFNDLGIDPLEQGTSVLDANRLLLFKYQLEPAINYFIYHVCSVGTQNVNFNNPSIENEIVHLEKHLLSFYSPEKKIMLCRASNGSIDPSLYQTIELQNLTKSLELINFSTTLFIPAELPTHFCKSFYKTIGGELYGS